MRKRVYIASPIVKGDLAHNINQATRAALELLAAGLSPFCPHWSCFAGGVVVDPLSRFMYARAEVLPAGTKVTDWYDADLAWVKVSDALLRLPGEGVGSDGEVAYATKMGIPVFYSVADVVTWAFGPKAA